VQKLLERGEIAYGITTGFGAFKDKIISLEEVELLQRNIVVSHAVGVGKPFDVPTTRAIMLIRANTLARGFSGIRLETLELLLEFINRGVHPLFPKREVSARAEIWRRSRICLCRSSAKAKRNSAANFAGENCFGKSRFVARHARRQRRLGFDERHDDNDRRRIAGNVESDSIGECRRHCGLFEFGSLERNDDGF
jgi:hypothetical protein